MNIWTNYLHYKCWHIPFNRVIETDSAENAICDSKLCTFSRNITTQLKIWNYINEIQKYRSGRWGYLSQDLEYRYRFNINSLSTHIRSSYNEEIVFRSRNLKVNSNHSKNLDVKHLIISNWTYYIIRYGNRSMNVMS